MDRQIRRLGVAIVTLFVLLFVQVNYLQVVAANRLANNPANLTRLLIQASRVHRGDILARDGKTVLAKSIKTRGEFVYARRYPNGPLYADVTGAYPLVNQPSGLELTYNDYLSGRATAVLPSTLTDRILGRPQQGATVVTTIDPALQQVAARALGNQLGAVVALDPRNGQVLVLYSNPTFDPNRLASHDTRAATAAYQQLNKDPHQPLVPNADQQLYPPGSNFKMVTAAAAEQSGFGTTSTWPNPPVLSLPQTSHQLQNFGGEHCAGGAPTISLMEAFTISCNVTFGEIGLKLGASPLEQQAHAFGFDQSVPFDVPFAEGQFPTDLTDNSPFLAFSAIGQYSVAANPLQMALVAEAIAHGGVEMRPELVQEIRDSQGRAVRSFGPQRYAQPISKQTAADLTNMMVSVVTSGTGTAAQIPGIQVAGKTGTAQHGTGNEPPHAWFTAFAPVPNPQIVVSVLVLDGGSLGNDATGGQVAAPIAKQVIEAALGIHG